MFLQKLNKIFFKKALMVAAFTIIFEAALIPSLGGNLWHMSNDETERSTFSYVLDVVKDHRTGLGSIEEFKLAQVILGESIAHKIDPLFVLALIKTESTFYNWSKSFNGAVGLMQILPSTGKQLAGELKLKWKGEETLLNPFVNVKMGVHYFSSLKEHYNHDTKVSLAAYNIGPNHIDSKLKQGETVGHRFSERVLYNYRSLKERAEFY